MRDPWTQVFKSAKISAGTKRFCLKAGLVPLKTEKPEAIEPDLWVGGDLDIHGDVD